MRCRTASHHTRALAYDRTGRHLAAAGTDGAVLVWDVAKGVLRHILVRHKGVVHAAAFSPLSGQLATAGSDGTVRIWDPETGEQRTSMSGWECRARVLAFSPADGALALGCADGVVRFREPRNWTQIRAWPGHVHGITSMCFDPSRRAACHGRPGRDRARLGPGHRRGGTGRSCRSGNAGRRQSRRSPSANTATPPGSSGLRPGCPASRQPARRYSTVTRVAMISSPAAGGNRMVESHSHPEISGLHSRVSGVEASVAKLSSRVDALEKRLLRRVDDLQKTVDEFVTEYRHDRIVQNAHHDLAEARRDLEQEFGRHKEVRDLASGIIYVVKSGFISRAVILDVTERLAIKTPRYWLAPAILAVAAWLDGDKDRYFESIKTALSLDHSKTALFMTLLLRDQARNEDMRDWIASYLAGLEPTNLPSDFAIVIEAVTGRTLGIDSSPQLVRRMRAGTKARQAAATPKRRKSGSGSGT